MRTILIIPLLLALLLAGCTTNQQETPQDTVDDFDQIYEGIGGQEEAPEQRGQAREPPREETPQERSDNGRGCSGTKIIFEHPPVNLDKTEQIVPLGLMSGNHVTPVDHQYFQNFSNDKPDIEVYSPGKGRVTSIEHMPGAPEGEDYRIIIEHTCTISSIYIHIDTLSPKLAEVKLRTDGYAPTNIPVEAGEIIGYYASNVDYNVVDNEVVLPGLLIPEHYEGEPWKIHVPDTLAYFSPTIKEIIVEKSLRMYEPISGKFDHDIDGRLIGNWFRLGTGGYSGSNPEGYWRGHLSISPNYLDPDHIIVSMGDYGGTEKQFGVRGNAPDPATVDTSTGLVTYELVDYEYFTDEGLIWNRRHFAKVKEARSNEEVHGVILLEMIEDRRLKVEIFPGKTATSVSGFTEDATYYER